MQVQVSGKHVDVGDALRSKIVDELSGQIGKFFERGGNAEPCAVLLIEDSSESATQRAVEAANSSLAEYQRIERWLPWPEPDFPRTATGKPRLPLIAARDAARL